MSSIYDDHDVSQGVVCTYVDTYKLEYSSVTSPPVQKVTKTNFTPFLGHSHPFSPKKVTYEKKSQKLSTEHTS